MGQPWCISLISWLKERPDEDFLFVCRTMTWRRERSKILLTGRSALAPSVGSSSKVGIDPQIYDQDVGHNLISLKWFDLCFPSNEPHLDLQEVFRIFIWFLFVRCVVQQRALFNFKMAATHERGGGKSTIGNISSSVHCAVAYSCAAQPLVHLFQRNVLKSTSSAPFILCVHCFEMCIPQKS